jgi:hypothetical protein
MLLVAVTFAQPPAQLNFRFANPQVISGSPEIFSFDIEIQADQPGTAYNTIQLLLDFNTTAFGTSPSSTVTAVLDPAFSFPPYLSTGISYQAPNSILYGAVPFGNPPPGFASLTVVSNSGYQTLVTCQMEIFDNSQLAGVDFNIGLMHPQNQYITQTNPVPAAYAVIFDNDLLNFPLSPLGPPELIISEVADPETPDESARFVEIYNPSSEEYDFAVWDIYLSREQDGGTGVSSVQLTGTLPANGTYLIAADATAFQAKYNFAPDLTAGSVVGGNGNDSYFLSLNGDINSETPFDAYGVLGTDGSGTPWEYTDTKAVRKYSIQIPNPTFDINEWVVGPKDPNNVGTGTLVSYASDMTPGSHRANLDWVGGGGDNSWRNKGNWNPQYVPDAAHNVLIPAPNSVTVNDTTFGYCNDLNLIDPPVNPGPGFDLKGIDGGGGSINPVGEVNGLQGKNLAE